MASPTGRHVLQDIMIPAREGRAVEVRRGQVLRIIAVDGKQAGDCTFWNLHDFREVYHAGQTVALNMILGSGTMRRLTRFYSKPPRENLMLTAIDDPVGVHFAWNSGRCSRAIYALRDGIASGHRNCQDNLAEAVAPWGLSGDDVFDIFNLFMNVDVVDETRLVFKPPVADRGDYLDLRAEMDVLAAVSACPSDTVATNDYHPKRLQMQVWVPR